MLRVESAQRDAEMGFKFTTNRTTFLVPTRLKKMGWKDEQFEHNRRLWEEARTFMDMSDFDRGELGEKQYKPMLRQLNMFFQFQNYLPPGLMERLMVRLSNIWTRVDDSGDGEVEITMWANGIHLLHKATQVQMLITCEHMQGGGIVGSRKGVNATLKIAARYGSQAGVFYTGQDKACTEHHRLMGAWDVMQRVWGMTRGLVKWWSGVTVKLLVPCPVCMAEDESIDWGDRKHKGRLCNYSTLQQKHDKGNAFHRVSMCKHEIPLAACLPPKLSNKVSWSILRKMKRWRNRGALSAVKSAAEREKKEEEKRKRLLAEQQAKKDQREQDHYHEIQNIGNQLARVEERQENMLRNQNQQLSLLKKLDEGQVAAFRLLLNSSMTTTYPRVALLLPDDGDADAVEKGEARPSILESLRGAYEKGKEKLGLQQTFKLYLCCNRDAIDPDHKIECAPSEIFYPITAPGPVLRQLAPIVVFAAKALSVVNAVVNLPIKLPLSDLEGIRKNARAMLQFLEELPAPLMDGAADEGENGEDEETENPVETVASMVVEACKVTLEDDKEMSTSLRQRFGRSYDALEAMLKQVEGDLEEGHHWEDYLCKCSQRSGGGAGSGRVVWLCKEHSSEDYLKANGFQRAEGTGRLHSEDVAEEKEEAGASVKPPPGIGVAEVKASAGCHCRLQ
jgi:hypothetical protein